MYVCFLCSHFLPSLLPSLVSLGSCWRTKRQGNFRERLSCGLNHTSMPGLPGDAARRRFGMAGRKPAHTSLFMVGILACVGIFMPGHSINGSQSMDEGLRLIQMGRFGASFFVTHFFLDRAYENSILPWLHRGHKRSGSAEKSTCCWFWGEGSSP